MCVRLCVCVVYVWVYHSPLQKEKPQVVSELHPATLFIVQVTHVQSVHA